MALNLGDDVLFSGPALPEAFVRHELEKLLGTHLPKPKAVQGDWEKYRKELRKPLTLQSGRFRVKNLVLDPLAELRSYASKPGGDPVHTREGLEGPGFLWQQGKIQIRVFSCDYQADLDAPAEKGLTYRHTPQRIVERILLAAGERVGLLTNGDELRLLLSDPARPVSFISFRLNAWRLLSPRDLPDGFRLLLAFLDPKLLVRQGEQGEKPSKLEALLDAARLKQGQITKDLRSQARKAVEKFIQGVLDHPANRERFTTLGAEERERLPRQLWREALILIYRLLFILRGESSGVFRFATTSPWRHTYSPGSALAEVARQVLDKGAGTGNYLEQGLRKLFAIFEYGLRWTEATIVPLGGRLFGHEETPLLAECAWSEVGCAQILDNLLWTLEKPKGAGNVKEGAGRRRINYADLDVEDLGRVYEALLELEPGLATEPMVRLKRAKLEVVVPSAQGQKYRPAKSTASAEQEPSPDEPDDAEEGDEVEEESSGKKSKVEFVEEITPEAGSPGKFFLRVGLGRKASGSYYTPDSFVRFLVQETLRPQVEERSPAADPQPGEILKLKVLDPAMGSGHFLVGACRFLGERLYEACRACADKGLWDRIPTEVAPYLPGRVQEGQAEVGVSADRARAICKRLVAVHCLYGVDKNELAVELAKVCLWLESQAEGMPLTFLDHRLVHGDSLTGPFWTHLTSYPVEGKPVEGLFAQGVQENFGKRLAAVLTKMKWLEQNVGTTPDEIAEKQKLKAEIDAELFPFRMLAMAWSGAVMLGESQCDGRYEALLKHIAEHGNLPGALDADMLPMLQRGTGMEKLPTGRQGLLQTLSSARGGVTSGPALSYDLTFPEVFYPTGVFWERQGFHAVLGNPPWETIRRSDDEFFGAFDFRALAGATKREKKLVQQDLLQNAEIKAAYCEYVDAFQEMDSAADRLFSVHQARVGNQLAGRGTYDAYMLFAERACHLLRQMGRVGWVLPSAFHANEGATGVRRLYLQEMAMECCYSFENRRKLFEIHRSFKFANVVAQRGCNREETGQFSVAFYLQDDEWLFAEDREGRALKYNREFVETTGGEYLTFLELRSATDREVSETCFAHGEPFGSVCEALGVILSQELNMTYDADRFTPTAKLMQNGEDPRDPDIAQRLLKLGYLVLHEGKTFWHYDDHWGDRARYLVSAGDLDDKREILSASRYYRIAFRDIASATNERCGVFCVLPPCFFSNKAPCERKPGKRPATRALRLQGLANSFPFDYLLRFKVQTTVNLFILNSVPVAGVTSIPFIVHSVLRLTCNHSGYKPLWREQLGDTWRETKPPFTWPVLATDDDRWEVRAAIDAVVADAYGLSREQYAHVLSTFSHKSYPKAPVLCLEKFDELKQIGLDAFTKRYDPYWDIPLNESLPKPVIDLPLAEDGASEGQAAEFRLTSDPPLKWRSRRKRQ